MSGNAGSDAIEGPGSSGQPSPAGTSEAVGAPNEAGAVSVAYRVDERDLRAAAGLAMGILPQIVRLRRVCRFSVGVMLVSLVIYLGVGGEPSLTVVAPFALGLVLLPVLSSRRWWGWSSARSPMSRRTLGDVTFRADHAGIATSVEGSTGTHTWSSIDCVAEGDDAVVFAIARQFFVFVMGRVLSDDDRATLRRLAAGGPKWVDLRAGHARSRRSRFASGGQGRRNATT